jgi:hypothetical protein
VGYHKRPQFELNIEKVGEKIFQGVKKIKKPKRGNTFGAG